MRRLLQLFTRKSKDEPVSYRSLGLRLDTGGRPASLNEEARSVEVVAATEAPVSMYDWDMGFVNEVLPMSRMRMPKAGQIVLLDSHNRWSTQSIIGSCRGLRVDADELLGTAVFSKREAGEDAFGLVREGHLTDVSVGYRVYKHMRIAEGETAEIDGKTYDGPLLVALDWEPKELSFCPIGADPAAKARAEAQPTEEEDMKKFLERLRSKLGLPEDASMRQIVEAMGQRGFGSEQVLEMAERSESDQQSFLDKVGKAQSRGDANQPAAPDLEIVRSEAVRIERERGQEIRAMCERHGCAELADKLISDGKSVDQARAALLENLEAKRTAGSGQQQTPGFHVSAGPTDQDKFRSAGTDALLLRGGVRVDTPAPGAQELRVLTLRELARECLLRNNQRIPNNPLEMVGRAFTSSDLPILLSDSSRRAMEQGYQEAAEDWSTWCGTGSLSDFKETSLVRLGAFGDLDEIPEDGEYEQGKLAEAAEKVKIAKYGKIFVISREAVINDDLGALTAIPANMGRAAGRTVGGLPYAVLMANAAMADNVALFHATHKNLGNAGVISKTTLGEAEKLMATQKGIGNSETALNIMPEFLVAPIALKVESETYFSTVDLMTIDGSNVQTLSRNIYAGKFTRIYNPRLDVDSATAWYLAGRKGSFINLYFLFGNQTPWLESRNGWSVDGLESKVRIEAASKAIDHRTGFKNAGQ